MSKVKTKVCGLRDKENILEIIGLVPDYIGFIFYPKSARYAGDQDLEFIRALSTVKKVAVFVNASETEINNVLDSYPFDVVQLHGAESPTFCETIRSKGVEVIKAFGLDDDFDFNQLTDYQSVVDYFLFDTKTVLHGGSGKRFDWKILEQYKANVPYFISGGIDEDAFREAKKIDDDRLYCIDINSKFELESGIKSIPRLKAVLK